MPLLRIEPEEAPADLAGLSHLPWADDARLEAYRARMPGAELVSRVDALQVTPPEFLESPTLVIRALENALAQMLQNWMEAAAETLDQDTACRLSRAAGQAHGKRVLGTYLREHGLKGGPKAMVGWQDTSHAMRGPRHTSALYARYSEKLVEVVRTEDSMNSMSVERPPILQAFLDGVVEGYQAADPSLLKIEEFVRSNDRGQTEYVHLYTFR